MISRLHKINIGILFKVSMTFIGLIILLSFLNLYFIAEQQKNYAVFINKSGKQRMMFERLQMLLYEYLVHPNKDIRMQLHEQLQYMQFDYQYLHNNLNPLFLKKNIYTHAYGNSVLQYIYSTSKWIESPESLNIAKEIIAQRSLVLNMMDEAVNILQETSNELSQELIIRSILLLGLILGILGMISLFVFNPLLQKLTKKHLTITQTNQYLTSKIEEATQRLQHSLDILNQYVYSSSTDIYGNIISVSDAFCNLCGYSREELIGNTHRIIKHPDNTYEVFIPLWETILRGEIYWCIVKNTRKDGTDFWLESMIVPDMDPKGKIIGFQAYRRDITDKKRLEALNEELEIRIQQRTAEIEKMAITDQLTEIPNRHILDKEINDTLSMYSRYQISAVISIFDIDFFKKINDTYGHFVGDKVLHQFAQMLKNNIRTTDRLARYGGEEFVIIFNATFENEAATALNHLLKIIRETEFETVGKITCSIGATAVKETDTAQSIFLRADHALYDVKEHGRNAICFE